MNFFFDVRGVVNDIRKINEVMYISMVIHADVLLYPAVFHVSYQLTLYQCTLCVPTGYLISYDETTYLNDEDAPYLESIILSLEVTGPTNYVLIETDTLNIQEYDRVMSAVDPAPEERPDSIVNHYVQHHHRHLTDVGLTVLMETDAVHILGSVLTVGSIVQQMMNRYRGQYTRF